MLASVPILKYVPLAVDVVAWL
jgi:hypothetical protein